MSFGVGTSSHNYLPMSFGTDDKKGAWQPLPYIHSGFVVHPYHPSTAPPTPPKDGQEEPTQAAAYRDRYSSTLAAIGEEGRAGPSGSGSGARKNEPNPYEVSLDIGDEFFAFEEYRCTVEEDGRGELWYRGYIVQAVSLSSLIPTGAGASGQGTATTAPRPEPSVLIGIFPASCVYIRPEASTDDETLSAAYEAAVLKAQENDRERTQAGGRPPIGTGQGAFGRDMEAVQEEDEEEPVTPTPAAEAGMEGASKASGQVAGSPVVQDVRSPVEVGKDEETPDLSQSTPAPAAAKRKSLTFANGLVTPTSGPGPGPSTTTARPKSLILERRKTLPAEEAKDQPPLPRLTAGDSTVAGQQWPLVDEIACAIRDWYQRLPTYLINRDYRLFTTVIQHIDALWLGRRQLLSQTLSGEELTRVRRECVSRLVKCNVAQGLEIIVRSLDDGSVMVTDKQRAFSGATWMGGVASYMHQLQFAYIDLIPLDTLFGKNASVLGLPSLTNRSHRFSLAAAKAGSTQLAPTSTTLGSYNHIFLDVRAFIASPCAPGETAELYFSLFSTRENRFITEEFCLILNHQGSPARDAEHRLGRLRTLFIDLKSEDMSSPIYLICRLVRNGAFKIRTETMAGTLESPYKGGNASRRSGQLLSDRGTMRGVPSISETVTDDSFSITSGFGGHRVDTVQTTETTTAASVADGRPTFRRPLGCAVLQLPPMSKLLNTEGDTTGIIPGTGAEYTMPIYIPRDEGGFATLHEDIISQQSKDYLTSSRAEAIVVSLKMLQGNPQQLVREHPSLLLQVPLTSRLTFPDVVPPNTTRNDLYVKLWSGSFVPSPASSGGSIRVRRSGTPSNHGNVQVTIEVRKPDGTIVPDVMFAGGSGEPAIAQYHSLVFNHLDKPTFGELIKVTLSTQAAPDCHLFLTFRSRTGKERIISADSHELEKPFAFAYLPLVTDAACIKDGPHDLVLYRMEKNLQPTPILYYNVPPTDSSQEGSLSPVNVKTMTPLRDRMMLRTYLCSSTQTQDDALRGLFKWQTQLGDIPILCKTLDLFSFVNEEEISKFIPTVLDSLFGILVSNLGEKQDEVDGQVFKALVKVLSMTTDRRFPNFAAVLDDYISNHFTFSSSSFNLLRSMKSVMSRPEDKEYRSFLKVWHLFFRLIIRSRELDREKGFGLDATSAHIEADFQRQMKGVLSEINNLMKSTDKGLIGTQTLAVQHYADVLPYLAQVFPPIEIAEMIIAFADTLTYSKGSIAVYKLLLLLQVIKHIFDSSDARALLVPALVRWAKPHLGKYEENAYVRDPRGRTDNGDMKRVKWLECNRLAVTVVAWMISKLQDWLDSPLIGEDETLKIQEEDNIEYCLTLLPTLLDSYAELGSPSTAATLQRHRSSSSATNYKRTPDVFPSSHPFALISELPPPSLLDRTHTSAADDILPSAGPFIPGLAESAVVIFTLVLASPPSNIARFFSELLDIEGNAGTAKVLRSMSTFCRSILRFEAFPKSWLTLSLMCFSAMLELFRPVSDLLESGFIPPVSEMATFDQSLWTECLELLCEFCGSEELALEDHSPQRRRAEWIIAGDLRDEGSKLLMKLWNALGWQSAGDGDRYAGPAKYGGYQTRFTSLAGRILTLCMSSHDQLCESGVEILFSMIYAEYILDGRLDSIASEIFAKLELLFLSKSTSAVPTDPTMRAYFVAHLRSIFEASPSTDAAFHSKVATLMDEIELFVELLLDLREIPDGLEWKDERSLAIYRLSLFTQRIGRDDLYVRFVHQLVKLNLDTQDWLGAGLALRLHADLYEWKLDGDLLDVFTAGTINLPAQTQFARKESLYYHAIDYFAEAEAYEAALELCQELVAQHQRLTYHVPKLSELLGHQAKLWERIGSTSRRHPEYFRVAYFGDFSNINKDKDYVVRGRLWQRYSDMCDEIQHKYPSATIHRSKVPPPESVRDGDDQVIWITSIHPEPEPDHPALRDSVVEPIREYHSHNGITRFSFSRPYVRGDEGGDTVLTWIEKTWLTTAKPMPGVLNRAEVVEIQYAQISPIATALTEIRKATKALKMLTIGRPDTGVDVKLLGTMINGAVDSPVNGGVKLYRDTFLTEQYRRRHPQDASQVSALDAALKEYVSAIQQALTVHKSLSRDVAFHEALKSHFYSAFPDEISALPPWSDSSHSVQEETRSMSNGHAQTHTPKASIATIQAVQPQNSRLKHSSARLSMMSLDTEAGYLLPELRVGPSLKPRAGPSVTVDTTHLTSPSQQTLSPNLPSVPASAGSSPRQSTISAGGGAGTGPGSIKRNSLSPSLPTPNGGGFTRAKSLVGSLGARSRTSLLSDGTDPRMGEITERDEGNDGMVIDITPSTPSTKKLGRFGSFMRRKET